MTFSLLTLKRGLVFFWALWLTIVWLTNVTDLLKHFNILGADFTFASYNYDFMRETTAIYALPAAMVLALYIGVIVWEGLAALLLWRAFAAFRGTAVRGLPAVYTAFAFSLALWAAFVVVDEFFIAYEVEGTHMAIFTSQLVTLLAVRLLPEDA